MAAAARTLVVDRATIICTQEHTATVIAIRNCTIKDGVHVRELLVGFQSHRNGPAVCAALAARRITFSGDALAWQDGQFGCAAHRM